MKNYKKRVYLVEPTKLLERVTVDNLRFLNPLGHDYAGGAYDISPVVSDKQFADNFAEYTTDKGTVAPPKTNLRNEVYKNIYTTNAAISIYKLCFWSMQDGAPNAPLATVITLKAPDNTALWTGETNQTTNEVMATVLLTQKGTYTLEYKTKITPTDAATYTFSVIGSIARKPYTITDVIERILNAGLGVWNGYYKLDPALAERWRRIPAPEFEITGKTLYEALLMVGGYKDVQAIPRLGPTPGSEATGEDWKFNYITFTLLNEGTEWVPPSGCIDRQVVHNGESYCGALESSVDNFVDNSPGGAVRQAFPLTVRTESADLVIDDNYAIIKTEFPIYKINKVTQARINGSDGEVGDITPYIFEKSEYDNLTSYTGDFPNAKQFALYYIQGQPNIYGLVLKPQVATALGLADKKGQFAAVQIAEKRSGHSYDSSNGVAAFAYQVSYTPMSTRRIKQFRPTDKYPNENTLIYNQSANVVDSRNYGGRMKGELARIGNEIELETYRIYDLADKPKVGQTKDGKKITQVDWEIGTTSMKVTIHLVKNYNRLSEYVGINSMQRFYEVSEKQATNRACNFSYLAKIGAPVNDGKAILTKAGVAAFAKTFKQIPDKDTVGDDEVTFCVVQSYEKDGTQIGSPTVHEVSGNGFGNSMSFYFSFEDNYSAGGQALKTQEARKAQRAVPYGNEYGEVYSMKMEFYKYKTTRNISKYPNGFTYGDQVNDNGWCNRLPEVQADDFDGEPYISYTAVIDKNGGEKISVETQIHFQANEEDVVIGSALGEENLLIGNAAHEHYFVCLPYKLEYLQETIPLEDLEKYKVINPCASSGATITGNGLTLYIPPVLNSTQETAQSWACVNESGNILIGRNGQIERLALGKSASINFELTIE
ncbi:MAG: hypothetical protein OSJ74_00040 [Clostridia bacterium]|nr:hypothetical protein [Clostridia bacterium]